MPYPHQPGSTYFDGAEAYEAYQDDMAAALEADGEKLRQLTGEDHGPVFLADTDPPLEQVPCEACEGSGVETYGIWVHEPGCGYGHDSTDERPCPVCMGAGFIVREIVPDAPREVTE